MSSIRYQPHIDGLRAVAVLLVVLHHLGDWAAMRGGYVGVDVFFVISGFLITSIVRKELEAGSFTFGGFYKRRVIRLAPAYFTVLLATTFAALIWMLPAELLAYVRSMAASSLFFANFHMWKEVGGYFGADAHTAPLLHLWSLAVEEQFYLFWPVAMLLGHRLLKKPWMPWVVALIAIAGVSVSQWGVVRYPSAAYYLLPTRFFELAVGALLAYLPAVEHGKRNVPFLASITGVALILYGAMAYGRETLFPGYHALAPVLGTALLLRWGAEGPVGRVLSTPLATGIGKVSYPAYLWHWPIIAFLHINEVSISVPIGLGVLTATFVLSWLTYRGFELPARRFLARPAARVVAVGAGLPITTSVAVAFVILALQGLPGRFAESLNKKSEALLAFPNKARGRCNEGPITSPLPPDDCLLGRAGGPVDFLLIGDSHANHFTGFMDELGKAAGMRGYDITQSQTGFFPGTEFWVEQNGRVAPHRNFVARNRYIEQLLVTSRYRTIVLAANFPGYTKGLRAPAGGIEIEVFEQSFQKALSLALKSATTVVVVTTVPHVDELYDCSLKNERFDRREDCRASAFEFREQVRVVTVVYEKMRAAFPSVVWVTPDSLLCGARFCATEMDGVPLYKDGGHLNDVGSRALARKWLQRFGNPLIPVQ